MKKLLMLVAMAVMILAACEKEDSSKNNKQNDNQDNTEYYVKYYASGGRYYLQSLSVVTDKGTERFTDGNTTNWTQTYGPVSKGFSASIAAKGGIASLTTVQIYVSKGGAPFVIKASGNESASYIIDF